MFYIESEQLLELDQTQRKTTDWLYNETIRLCCVAADVFPSTSSRPFTIQSSNAVYRKWLKSICGNLHKFIFFRFIRRHCRNLNNAAMLVTSKSRKINLKIQISLISFTKSQPIPQTFSNEISHYPSFFITILCFFTANFTNTTYRKCRIGHRRDLD